MEDDKYEREHRNEGDIHAFQLEAVFDEEMRNIYIREEKLKSEKEMLIALQQRLMAECHHHKSLSGHSHES
jgi:hypothetical protein